MRSASSLSPALSSPSTGIDAAASPVLDIHALSVAYDEHAVVEQLNLQLPRGDIGCVVGASGCGKTTLLRAIAGFVPLQAGSISIAGRQVAGPRLGVCAVEGVEAKRVGKESNLRPLLRTVAKAKATATARKTAATWDFFPRVAADALVPRRRLALPPEQRGIGLVFQDYALFPHLRVEDNVGFGLRRWTRAARTARVAELLALVGLSTQAQRYPHELSGGQQQRVALARALAPQPALLLMDEPFSSLDVELRARLSTEVRQILKACGTSAILVTHDQQEAFAIADRVGVMHAGRLEQWDRPYELYHRPATRYVADFIGEGVFVPARVLNPNRVAIELGELNGTVPPHLNSNSDPHQWVDVLLRPDDVIHDDASPQTAEVVRKTFRGGDFVYVLRLPSGQEILALVPSHHDHAIGERIGVRLDADHVVMFAAGPAPTF